MSNINPNCDGSHCRDPKGEVRLYPTGGGGNMIYCKTCFAHENRYRFRRGLETGHPENWPRIHWADAERYEVAS